MNRQATFDFVPTFAAGDRLRMTVPRGNKYESIVKEVAIVDGSQFVRFCIDWDEGPATYFLPASELEKVEC